MEFICRRLVFYWHAQYVVYAGVELVNVEAVVQCIRNTSSPQIQQQALIVMTAIAPLYPVCIFHYPRFVAAKLPALVLFI